MTTSGRSEATTGAWLAGLLAVLAVGAAAALYLTRLHLDLFYGAGVGGSLCDLSESLSCSSVNGSAYSTIGGVPNALLAIPTYALMATLGWRARRRGRGSSEIALLFGLGLLTVGYSAVLAYLSHFVIGAWCLFCIALYLVNISVTVLAWRGAGEDASALLVRGLRALAFDVNAVGISAVTFAVAFGLSYGVYAGQKRATLAESAAAAVAAPAEAATEATAAQPSTAQGTATTPSVGGELKRVRVSDDRATLDLPADAPSLGPADAPVTLVEFSDFQCPFCRRLVGTVHQIHDAYPDQVRVVFMNFPMEQDCNAHPLKKSLHPAACEAAVAARCAHRQGRFWDFHDALFEQQRDLTSKRFSAIAADLGLDKAAFAACLSDPATLDEIRADTAIGSGAGVSGTPNLFVNGRSMSGAQPFEVFAELTILGVLRGAQRGHQR